MTEFVTLNVFVLLSLQITFSIDIYLHDNLLVTYHAVEYPHSA